VQVYGIREKKFLMIAEGKHEAPLQAVLKGNLERLNR
jgi:hypothetical protein